MLAQGSVDGINRVFATGEPYVPGSTAYILNGRIHNRALPRGPDNDYGYIELDPASGTIQVDNPPRIDDVVQIFFWSRKVLPAPAVDRIVGVVSTPQRVQGVIREQVPTRLVGVVRRSVIQGVVREPAPDRLVGQVTTQRIIGVIKEKCP